ncbi:MAG TPA: hypothetical protein VGD81_07835 [Opitutaceae bacterium]
MSGPPAAAHTPFQVAFGERSSRSSATLHVELPVLGGLHRETIFVDAEPAGEHGALTLHRAGHWLLGHASTAIDPRRGLEAASLQLYRDLVAATHGWHLARIWNYVPGINAPGPDQLENYRAFCRGRSLAFESEFGGVFKRLLPAASAVGCDDDRLTVIFAAHERPVQHFENPQQVPAYDYPPEHGPRPPSFARATVVAAADAPTVFISGTAAIKGHATIAPDDTLAQLACTLDNLSAISRVCGLGDDLAAGRAQARHVKIYLRRAADYAAVSRELAASLLRPGDQVSYLRSDICRAALNVEIEATIVGAALAR